MAEQRGEFTIGNVTVVLRIGDLAQLGERVDAIVSPDDNYLTHGGGVSAAIWAAAGPQLADSANRYRPDGGLALGAVLVTHAGALAATDVLHAITLDYDANRSIGPREAKDLYGGLLDTALEIGSDTMATPLLGAGVAGLGVQGSITALAEALMLRAYEDPGIHRLTVVVTKRETLELCLPVLERHHGPHVRLGERIRILVDQLDDPWAESIARSWKKLTEAEETTESALEAVWLFHLLVDRGLQLSRTRAEERLARLEPGQASDQPSPRAVRDALVRASGRSSDKAVKRARTGVAARVRQVAELERLLGEPLAPKTISTAEHAVRARNAIVHEPDMDKDNAVGWERVLLGGIAAWVGWLSQRLATRGQPTDDDTTIVHESSLLDTLGGGDAAPTPDDEPPVEPVCQAPADTGSPRLVGPSDRTQAENDGRSTSLDDTGPVRELHRFLRERLDERALDDLIAQLRSEGYRGEEASCLLEFCVRVPDPARFVASQFPAWQLRDEVRDRVGLRHRADTDALTLAHDLLAWFGFPVVRHAKGLSWVRARLRALRASVHTCDEVQLRGAVTDAARWLEYLNLVLLRFLCQAAFRQVPELFLVERGWLEEGRRLHKCSLGALLDLLSKLATHVVEHPNRRIAEFGKDFEAHRLAPTGTHHLAALRNKFAHFDERSEAWSLAEQRRVALDFFDEAEHFADHLATREHRVFPYVLRIERIEVDGWGRRTVIAISDEGLEETVFTDRELLPGEQYFMHPLSNPLRVDPILVQAGELVGPRPRPRDKARRG